MGTAVSQTRGTRGVHSWGALTGCTCRVHSGALDTKSSVTTGKKRAANGQRGQLDSRCILNEDSPTDKKLVSPYLEQTGSM